LLFQQLADWITTKVERDMRKNPVTIGWCDLTKVRPTPDTNQKKKSMSKSAPTSVASSGDISSSNVRLGFFAGFF
jgi:hypothetical protein